MLQVLDLFSGIGGFSLGLERTGGFRPVAFCEIDPYCKKVLARHWPDVRCYDDVRSLSANTLRHDGIAVDVICGGFPCQDISVAGSGLGLDGDRSGLWSQFSRLVGELRPQYVIVENVPALLIRGMDRVLGDLAAFGYDAEWHCIPGSAAGSSQWRDRLWIIAYPLRVGAERLLSGADFGGNGCRRARGKADLQSVANAPFERGDCHPEPLLRGMARRVPNRVDRIAALGNSLDPAIPELIGRAILRDHLHLAI